MLISDREIISLTEPRSLPLPLPLPLPRAAARPEKRYSACRGLGNSGLRPASAAPRFAKRFRGTLGTQLRDELVALTLVVV